MHVLVEVSLISAPPSSVAGIAHHPAVVLPRLGPCPLGIATELPGTGVALAQGSCPSSGGAGGDLWLAAGERLSRACAPTARTTSCSALKLCPLTSASQYGSAATMPPACTEKELAETRGLTHTIRWASRARRSISRPTSPISSVTAELPGLVGFLTPAVVSSIPALLPTVLNAQAVTGGWENVPGTAELTSFHGAPVRTVAQVRTYFSRDLIPVLEAQRGHYDSVDSTSNIDFLGPLVLIVGAIVIAYGLLMVLLARRVRARW